MADSLTVDAVVTNGKIEIVDRDFYRTRTASMAKRWGEGAALKIVVMPGEDAAWAGQFRYLFGRVFEPASEFSGYTKQEICLMCKAEGYLPEGKQSLTELSREELSEFTRQSEQFCRENWPDAFALMG